MPLLTPLDPDLTLTRTQYPAIVCNQEKTEPFTFRGSVNRRVANVTTVGQEAIQSFGELSGKKSSQPIDGSSYSDARKYRSICVSLQA